MVWFWRKKRDVVGVVCKRVYIKTDDIDDYKNNKLVLGSFNKKRGTIAFYPEERFLDVRDDDIVYVNKNHQGDYR